MTIEFVCKQVAELFDSPCNFSPVDREMLDLDAAWCEKFWLKWKEEKAREK